MVSLGHYQSRVVVSKAPFFSLYCFLMFVVPALHLCPHVAIQTFSDLISGMSNEFTTVNIVSDPGAFLKKGLLYARTTEVLRLVMF